MYGLSIGTLQSLSFQIDNAGVDPPSIFSNIFSPVLDRCEVIRSPSQSGRIYARLELRGSGEAKAFVDEDHAFDEDS